MTEHQSSEEGAEGGMRDRLAAIAAETYYTGFGWGWDDDELDPADRATCINEMRPVVDAILRDLASPTSHAQREAYVWTRNDQADHEAGHPSGFDCDGYAMAGSESCARRYSSHAQREAEDRLVTCPECRSTFEAEDGSLVDLAQREAEVGARAWAEGYDAALEDCNAWREGDVRRKPTSSPYRADALAAEAGGE